MHMCKQWIPGAPLQFFKRLGTRLGCHVHTSEDHWYNQNYMTTSHFVEMSAVGAPGHDVRFACLVYFLYRYIYRSGCSAVVKCFMEHMSATWCDDNGWTLLHYACR